MRASAIVLAISSIVPALFLLALRPGTAAALPALGTEPPDVRLEDPDGRQMSLATVRGAPTLVLYEDRDSASQNSALKSELAALRATPEARHVKFVPIADVSAYAHWPLKSWAKSAIRARAQNLGTTIWCDWRGTARSALGFHPGMSSLVAFDRTGRVMFSAEGPLPPEGRAQLITLLKSEAAQTD